MERFFAALRYDIRSFLSVKTIVYALATTILYVTLQPYVHTSQAKMEHVYLGLIGGFAYEEIIVLEMDNVFIWSLMLLTFFIGISGIMQAEYDGRCRDTLYRFPSYRRWYLSKALASVVSCAALCCVISVGVILGCLIWGVTGAGTMLTTREGLYTPAWPYCLMAFGFLLCSSVMLTQWQMTVHMLTGNVVFATVSYLLPIVASLYSASNTFLSNTPLHNPINWGMLARSEVLSDPGFDVFTAVVGQLGLGLIFFLIGYACCAKVNLACRCRQDA